MQTVCFETAKLAKEKGFNYMYSTNQHDLLDWLRELHNLHIEILYDYENDNTSYHYTIRTIGKENGRDWKEDYATYEECLETALQEALKMI
jgi:hypothetical protein